ncbi:MAG: single-stranded-DNA-specific exonuclease RecJ [Candidatus Omnitrophica bacterium]|jgi:single-stranded-DNA-specific exonuclease|nr:single-stranded-DNA-specific exonuclease RecJ [Candidatus Omnitrophota bacterium]
MKRYLWKIKPANLKAQALAQKHDISISLAQILLNRDIDEDNVLSFINPNLDDLYNPFLLPDIDKGIKRLKIAVEKKEKILIFGDYDVDGITSLAIFNEFAKNYPTIFSFYIPHRVKEGYGLNREAIIQAKEKKVTLIIAFDCGTNSCEEIKLAASFGIDIIVIDHHLPKEDYFKPFALINPKRKDSQYPFSELSAGALSFKFLQALTKSLCRKVLDLVALSVVCDVVPLVGENRALLKEGLGIIRESKRYSISALCKVSGIKQENIDVFHIGFILGPRINSSGRVAHPKDSLELFLAEDQEKANKIALRLNEYNRLRRGIEAQILKEAEGAIEDNLENKTAIVVSGDKWHVGVLGVVASRLADKYNRPSFVISFDEKIGKGSARSTQNIHLLELLDECADSLLLYGGHKKAAGVLIAKEELESFKERINTFIEENINPHDFIPAIDIDMPLSFKDIDLNFIEWLDKLKPYGEGNPQPLFVAHNVFKKSAPQKVNSHFSLWLSNADRTLEGTVYRQDLLEIIEYSDYLDIVFSLEKNHYYNSPKLLIRDCRLADNSR